MRECTYSENVLRKCCGIERVSAEVSQKSLLSNRQHRKLMSFVAAGDPDEKHQLIAQNLRMVVNVAERYSDHGIGLLDLIREGNRGLIHAMENLGLEGGLRFAAHAERCVRQSIECTIMNQMEPE